MSVAERVKSLAAEHGITIDENDRANFLAKEFSRLEGIEGDETLDLLAELVKHKVLTKDEGIRLVLEHGREVDDSSDTPSAGRI